MKLMGLLTCGRKLLRPLILGSFHVSPVGRSFRAYHNSTSTSTSPGRHGSQARPETSVPQSAMAVLPLALTWPSLLAPLVGDQPGLQSWAKYHPWSTTLGSSSLLSTGKQWLSKLLFLSTIIIVILELLFSIHAHEHCVSFRNVLIA